jgi:hypothetical protein
MNRKTLAGFASSLLVLIIWAANARGVEISGTISTTLTIHEDSELVGDVICMVANAPCIKFGAPGIKLRLHGFTITGRADPPANCTDTITFAAEDGIQVVAQDHAAVLGPGVVRKFARFGILLARSKQGKVKHVTVADNCFSGIQLSGAADSDIDENVSVRNAVAAAGFSCGGT